MTTYVGIENILRESRDIDIQYLNKIFMAAWIGRTSNEIAWGWKVGDLGRRIGGDGIEQYNDTETLAHPASRALPLAEALQRFIDKPPAADDSIWDDRLPGSVADVRSFVQWLLGGHHNRAIQGE